MAFSDRALQWFREMDSRKGISSHHIPEMHSRYVLSEILWFQFGKYRSSDYLENCFDSFLELKTYLSQHSFLLDCVCSFRHHEIPHEIEVGLLFPGVKLCVRASVISPECQPEFNQYGVPTYVSFTLDKTTIGLDGVTFHGTVQGKWSTFTVKSNMTFSGVVYSLTHLEVALAYSKYWREQANEQYQELSKCLASPEFASLVQQKYYDAKVMTCILRDYLYDKPPQ
jgi:hypothetical protein